MDTIPTFSVDLIKQLRAGNPMPSASKLVDLERAGTLQFELGKQALIELLETRLRQQEEDDTQQRV